MMAWMLVGSIACPACTSGTVYWTAAKAVVAFPLNVTWSSPLGDGCGTVTGVVDEVGAATAATAAVAIEGEDSPPGSFSGRVVEGIVVGGTVVGGIVVPVGGGGRGDRFHQ